MAAVNRLINKQGLVTRLLTAKENTGKTFTQIAKEVGLTNVHTAQLFYNQVPHSEPCSIIAGNASTYWHTLFACTNLNMVNHSAPVLVLNLAGTAEA